MSSQTSGARAPVVMPKRPVLAPRPEKLQPEKPRRGRWWLIFTIPAVLLGGWLVSHRIGGKAKPVITLRTASVRVGPLESTLRVSGNTTAQKFAILTTPYLRGTRAVGLGSFNLTLLHLAKPGSWVRKGDRVAEFDRQYMLVRLDDYRAVVEQHEAYMRDLKAQLELKRKAYEQRIRTTKGTLDKANLDLKTAPVRSAIDTERFKLNSAEARLRYEQLVKDLKNVDISESSAIRRLELDLKVTRIEADRAQGNVDKMVVRAPIDGIVVVQTIHRAGEQWQIEAGDQLRTGQPFMQVVDPRSMVVEATVNQVDAGRLTLGLPARVRFEAFPDLELPAKLVSIGTLARGGAFRTSFVKHIPIRLKLEATDSRIIPNYSASADLILEREENVAYVPRECVFSEPAGQDPFVFVRGASGWEKREVELGLSNNVAVAVNSGLRQGEVVAAERPLSEPVLALQ